MIELPEAVNISGQLNDTVLGKCIASVTAVHTPHKLAWYYGEPSTYFDLLTGKTIGKASPFGSMVEMKVENANILFGEGVNIRFHYKGETRPAYSLINPSRTLPEKDYILITGGLLSGFTAGLIGLGGAIRGAFLISTKIRKETYVATSAAIALCTDIARCTTYVVRGSLESQYFWYIPVLIMVAFAGTRLGVRLLKRFPELIVKRVVLVALVLASISFILNYLGIINMG